MFSFLPICFCTKNLSYFSDPGEFWKFSPVSSLFPGMVTKTSQSLFSQKSRFQPTPNPLSSVPQKIFTNSFSSLKYIVVFVKSRTQGVSLWDSHPIDDHCHQNRRSEPRWRRWQFASLGHFVFLFLLKRKTNPLFKINIKTKANTAFPALKPRSMMIRMTKMT